MRLHSKTVFIIILLFTLHGCKKEPGEPDEQIKTSGALFKEGEYVGTFRCDAPSANGLVAGVAITFRAGTWTGAVKTEVSGYYPGLCRGQYHVKDSTISFINECAFNTFYDWTHILSDTFSLKVKDNKVELMRRHLNFTDKYELTRKE